MSDKFDLLNSQLEKALSHPRWGSWLPRHFPHPTQLPSPHLTWGLLCTLRYADLQGQAIRAYYACCGHKRDYANVESLGSGPTVNLTHPQWSFRFDGSSGGYEAVHTMTQHVVHIEPVHSCTEEMFEPSCAARHMQSDDPADLYHPLDRLHGSPCLVLSTLRLLCKADMLWEGWFANEDCLGYDHTPEALAFAPLVERFCEEWRNPENRVYLAALVNDWITVRDLAERSSDMKLHEYASERAKICRNIHVAALSEVEDEMSDVEVLCARRFAGVEDLHDFSATRIDEPLHDECPMQIPKIIADRTPAPVLLNFPFNPPVETDGDIAAKDA